MIDELGETERVCTKDSLENCEEFSDWDDVEESELEKMCTSQKDEDPKKKKRRIDGDDNKEDVDGNDVLKRRNTEMREYITKRRNKNTQRKTSSSFERFLTHIKSNGEVCTLLLYNI